MRIYTWAGGVLYSHCSVCPSRPHWHQQSRDHRCTLEPDPSASWQSDWVSRLLDAGTLQRLPQRNRNPNSRLDDDSHTRGAADIKCRRQHWMAMVCSSFKIQIRVGPYLTFFLLNENWLSILWLLLMEPRAHSKSWVTQFRNIMNHV